MPASVHHDRVPMTAPTDDRGTVVSGLAQAVITAWLKL